MTDWPDFEVERLAGLLLRVDLQEQRFLAAGEYGNVVNHLMRSAAAACLSDREDDALSFLARAAVRTGEWVRAAREGRARPSSFADYALARGWLAVAIMPTPVAMDILPGFLAMTGWQPAGAVHNARMVAALVAGDAAAAEAASKLCDLSDAGLGVPLKRFVLASLAGDEAAMRKALATWLQEKLDATMTHEWGAYNEVPLEVSGALALATGRGAPLPMVSNRVLTRYRAGAAHG